MSRYNQGLKSVTVEHADGRLERFEFEHQAGWLRVVTTTFKRVRGEPVPPEFHTLDIGGRIVQQHDDAVESSDAPESLPEKGEETNEVTA